MIIKNYQLVREKQVEVNFEEVNGLIAGEVLIRPKYLSICAADNRYFFAKRDKEVMNEKLPMSLIHEAIGEVVMKSESAGLELGDWVSMVPNHPTENHSNISENYLRSSQFRSSSIDGFMQEYIVMDQSEVIKIPAVDDKRVYVLSELLSVVIHSLNKLDISPYAKKIGIWGDGNLGYLTSLYLKKSYPDLEVTVIGKHGDKLDFFNFVDKVEFVDNISDKRFDIAVEAVGGKSSEYALAQIIDNIAPEGKILLLGVSEYGINVNTRMILEKGLTVQGASRSARGDFEKAVEFISSDESVVNLLNLLITLETEVNSIANINEVFEQEDSLYWGKAVMKWNL